MEAVHQIREGVKEPLFLFGYARPERRVAVPVYHPLEVHGRMGELVGGDPVVAVSVGL